MNNNQRHNADKRVIRTKKAIRNALFVLMECKSIEDISISELTAAANVNRRTFYTHYRSLTDILDEIEAEVVQSLAEMLVSVNYDEYANSVAKLFISFNELISGEFDTYFHLLQMDTRGILTSRLRNAIKVSSETIFASLPVGAQKNFVYVTSFIAGGFLAMFSEWYYGDKTVPVEEAADIVGRMSEHCLTFLKELE